MPEVDCQLYKQITVSGPDAVEFLQGQLTQDVSRLADAGRLLAAWCNPKGRVIVVIRLLSFDNGAGLVVPASMTEKLVARLTMYRLRSKVDFEVGDVATSSLDDDEKDAVALIRAGRAFIDESNSEAYTPHMLNLDKLGAISFQKGCYTGQEVVARTEHLGKSKRRLMRYEADVAGIRMGDKLSDGEHNVGDVVNVAGRELLAVTPVDIHGRPLKADGITVTPKGLPYTI
jgi:folate-binding protein YgfZ